MLNASIHIGENRRATAVIIHYPGILATPPVLIRVFEVPPRPGTSTASVITGAVL